MIDEQHIFNNRYRLDRKLGEGGMATVFCGTDTLLRRRVAVKVLRDQYARDEEFVRRFYQEAESAARLSHPNIVNTYDVGREGDTYFIVMELVDGPSLAEIIAADGKLPEPVAIDYAAQICSGLAYAHRQGLLHRDIKPANVLVTKDDVVKISDFGIARAVSQQTMAMTRPGLIMGSVFYVSPEQAQDMELHETSDLYSVGVVLYQMLTGRLPYTGESPVTVALKHVSDPVPTIDPAAGVSPAVAAIVNRLMQKDPSHRFQSASEVASALREARERPSVAAFALHDDSATQPMRAVPAPPPRPSRKPDRSPAVTEEEDAPPRRTAPFAALLALALLIAAAAGYFATRPGAPLAQIKVDNYVGMTDVQAQQAIVNAGLAYKTTRAPSDAVAANRVVSQDPPPETALGKNGVIQLVISSGKPSIGLHDVRGYMSADAQKDLEGDGLHVKLVHKFDPSSKGTVLDEHPEPGASTKVREGSTVTLVVSDGPAPIKAPDLVGKTLDQAQAIAEKLGFTVSVSEEAPIANIPPNVIASQATAPGKTMTAGSTMYVVVSKGGGLTQIPDVTGSTFASAQQTLQAAGFDVGVTYAFNPPGPDNGTVINEQPQGGTSAEKGSQVQLWLSVTGYVPDTGGMTLDVAKQTLLNYGYQLGNVTPTQEGADGKVVRTEPEAGTKLDPGTPVNIYINSPNPQPPGQP